MQDASILWRRLDVEGHDGCRLLSHGDGFELEGQAVFEHGGEPCCLAYRVCCDGSWLTRAASVNGFLGARGIGYDIERLADGTWTLNGAAQPQAEGLIDVDLNFTPATNLVAIRRFDLAVGAEMLAPAAWLAFPEFKLMRLDQVYRRLDQTRYAYQSPNFGYAEVLETSPAGFVLEYPQLWKAVALRPD
jgi:hypothetical protein